MILKPLPDVTLSDIEQLVANGISEGRTLEFKLELPGPKDDDIREFLADATSFANTDGGDLIYGVQAAEGVAVAVPGSPLAASPDATLLRLENLLRDVVQPRLSGVRFQWIPQATDRGVLVARVPASMTAPHRVTFRGGAKFHHRNSRGKAEMDTHELRLAFTASEALPARMQHLHEQTVRMVDMGDLPFSLDARPKTILSVLPLSLIRDARSLDVDQASAVSPPGPGSTDWLHALEGFYVFAIASDRTTPAFALTRRTGQVDICWGIGRTTHDGERLVWPLPFEKTLAAVVPAIIQRLAHWAIEGPFVIAVTLANVGGYRLYQDFWAGAGPAKPAWRSQLALPSIVVEAGTLDELMPLARSFWYAMSEKRPDGLGLGEGG